MRKAPQLWVEIGQDEKIPKCTRCGADIYWLYSKKGKPYPVNFIGIAGVKKNDFHKCGVKSKETLDW